MATGVVEGNLKVYFYGTGATMVAAGQGSNALKPATVFLAEFLFDGASQRLSAKFKCSDDAATGTFVRVRVLLHSVLDSREGTYVLAFVLHVFNPNAAATFVDVDADDLRKCLFFVSCMFG